MMNLDFAYDADGRSIGLPVQYANRHALITGSTGSGKTTTLQCLTEQFSAVGVPVFAADVKGDLSGIATACPVAFFDIFGKAGNQIQTSVHSMGAQMLSSMLRLNDAQSGAMEIAFRIATRDGAEMLTLDDLRWQLTDMLDKREDVCREFGNVTASSISAIQRNILALEAQGGENLFGEPPFDIGQFMRTEAGRGVVNLLHADQLLEAPKLYATFLLWLLTELFRVLPEAGDLPKPKLVFFFDEAHLLFADSPKPLLQKIERLVRLVRSKGVGVFFVTQSPTDVPATVLEQLGSRIMHTMRAHTAESLRKIKAAAATVRPRAGLNVAEALPRLAIGEALVSIIGEDNVPSEVEKVAILLPAGQLGPISPEERQARIVRTTPMAEGMTVTPDNAPALFRRRLARERGEDPGPYEERRTPGYEEVYAMTAAHFAPRPMARAARIGRRFLGAACAAPFAALAVYCGYLACWVAYRTVLG